jgi:CRISPR-associated protein Csb1
LIADIARWQIRTLLDGGLRLRTACDLEPIEDTFQDRSGDLLPDSGTLADRIRAGIDECRDLVDSGGPIEVIWSGGKARKKA